MNYFQHLKRKILIFYLCVAISSIYFLLLICPSAAVWAIYDSYFQREKWWRPHNHRAFKCTIQDNKKVCIMYLTTWSLLADSPFHNTV